MSRLVTNYIFDSANREVTFTKLSSIVLNDIDTITNIATDPDTVIFDASISGKSGTVSGNILTLDYDTTAMSDKDNLRIFYEDQTASSSPSSSVTVTNFPAVQPISGTVSTGGLTDAELRVSPVPVTGTVTITGGGDASAANQTTEIGLLTTIDGDTSNISTQINKLVQRPTTGAQSSVSASITNVTLLASNSGRLGATLYNDSTSIAYVRFAATATSSNFSVKMFPEDFIEIPFGYTGIIDCIHVSATGAVRITEFTA